MAHVTKDKGDLAVAKAIAHLLEHDIRVCMPLSEHLPFDFVAIMPDMTTLRRVQVKYRTPEREGILEIRFRGTYYDSKRIYAKPVKLEQIDCYAAYCPENDRLYYLRVDEIPQGSKLVTLRFKPAKNNQRRGVWDASEFTDPRRIAISGTSAPGEPRIVERDHAYATARIIEDLMQRGQYVCTPYLSNDMPFDLIAVDPGLTRLKRIRVYTANAAMSAHVDTYALYDRQANTTRYLAAEQITEYGQIGLKTSADVESTRDDVVVG